MNEAPVTSANQCLTFMIPHASTASSNGSDRAQLTSFHPEFTHQVFGPDEDIKGYTALEIVIEFHPVSFFGQLHIR